jgi:plasmid stabilization system protein ParE
MTYGVEVTDVADMETQEIFLWMVGHSPENAGRWINGLDQAIDSLSTFPTRCPLAPENDTFVEEVRQHLYGRYRILFTLLDVDDDGVPDTVRILHVRHGARRYLSPNADGETS